MSAIRKFKPKEVGITFNHNKRFVQNNMIKSRKNRTSIFGFEDQCSTTKLYSLII